MFKRFVFQFTNEWLQLKGKWNWYSFTPIYVYFEYEKMTEGLEFHLKILGFGFYIRYNLPASDKIFAEYEKEWEKLLAEEKDSN